MKKYILALLTLVASFAFSASTYATTLDFTSGVYTQTGSSTQYKSSYTEDGYSLDIISAGNHFDVASHIVGNVGFHNGPVNAVHDNNIILTMGGAAFNLTSMDFAGFQFGATSLDLIGSNGVMQSITGAAGLIALSFHNVTSVMFSIFDGATPGNGYAGWNSMEVSPIPVPAAAWLFGSALLGFFGFSRKKANA